MLSLDDIAKTRLTIPYSESLLVQYIFDALQIFINLPSSFRTIDDEIKPGMFYHVAFFEINCESSSTYILVQLKSYLGVEIYDFDNISSEVVTQTRCEQLRTGNASHLNWSRNLFGSQLT